MSRSICLYVELSDVVTYLLKIVPYLTITLSRWVTTTCVLDYSTVAIADKFGNISVVRLPTNTNDDVDEDPTGIQLLLCHLCFVENDRDEDPDPVIFGPPDPDPTCNKGFFKLFLSGTKY